MLIRQTLLRAARATVVGGLLAAAGVVLSLLLIEGAFRAYYVVYPSTERGFFWEPHPDFGWTHPAGRDAPWYDDHGEFQARVRINSKGLRDVERPYWKRQGTYRILILGDSFMEAVQVELEATMARLLEERLNQVCSKPIEVINSGVASFGTDNELLYLRAEGHRYDPDLVLLAFTTANDVRESHAPFNRQAARANLAKPYFELDGDGVLLQRPGPSQPPPLPWWRRTHVGRRLHERFGTAAILAPPPPPANPKPPEPNTPWVAPDMLVYAPNEPPIVRDAWQVTFALLEAVHDEAVAMGARFAVFFVNGPWTHYETDWARMTARHAWARQNWDRIRPNRIAAGFFTERNIPYLDLYGPFEEAKDGERLFFKIDPHWTEKGHRVAADAVAEFLLRNDLVPAK